MRASPSLYEGAFRLETTARPSDMFAAGAMLLGTPPSSHKQEDDSIAEDDDDSLSSPPVDESYKIRIGGPTMELHRSRGGSLSPPPRSHEGEDDDEEDDERERKQRLHGGTGGEVQDLSVSSAVPHIMSGGDNEPMEAAAPAGGHHGGHHPGYHSEESNQ